MPNPSDINAQPSIEQLYAMLGEVMAENRVLKTIIAQHPEIVAAHDVTPSQAAVPETRNGEE